MDNYELKKENRVRACVRARAIRSRHVVFSFLVARTHGYFPIFQKMKLKQETLYWRVSVCLSPQRFSGLCRPVCLSASHGRREQKCLNLIKAGATQTETSLLKQYVAGSERVDLLDEKCLS